MHIRSLVLALSLLVITFYNQSEPTTLDTSSLKLNGLSFFLKKEVILSNFGEPIRIFEPKYECGFLSEAEQGNKYYSLDYGNLKFTGNSEVGYQLEVIQFGAALKSKVTFRKKVMSNKTTKKEFEAIFGVKLGGSEKTLYNKGSDDAYIFTFLKGHLSKIEYWSPC